MIRESGYLYLEDILSTLKQTAQVIGNREAVKFNKVTTLDQADEHALIWLKPNQPSKQEIIRNTAAKVIIADETIDLPEDLAEEKCVIRVEEPKYAIINIISRFFQNKYEKGIDKSATINCDAQIADDVFIGPNVYIGAAEIGAGVIIEGNCYIYDKTIIKRGSIIQAGAVIGPEGFGHFKTKDKTLVRFPHIGRAVLSEDVQIGSNSVINRGTLGETYIGKGSKVNKICNISHNVTIGKNNFIAHSVCINGSARIGDNNYIGAGANIRNKVTVGNDTVVGMGAVVLKDVADNTMVYGNPAQVAGRSPNKPLF